MLAYRYRRVGAGAADRRTRPQAQGSSPIGAGIGGLYLGLQYPASRYNTTTRQNKVLSILYRLAAVIGWQYNSHGPSKRTIGYAYLRT